MVLGAVGNGSLTHWFRRLPILSDRLITERREDFHPDLALVSIFIFKLLLDMSSRNKMDGMRNAKCEMRDARCEMRVRLYRREPAGAPGEVP